MSPLNAAEGHASLPRMVRRFTRAVPRDSFEKSVALRARHGRFNTPQTPEALRADVRQRMKLAEQTKSQRPIWHFKVDEVASIDFDDGGQVLFQLQDGRVFDDNGDPR